VKGTKKEHHKKNRREDNLRTRHIQHHAVEPRSKLENRLRRALHVVEKGQESPERIRNRVRPAMLVQDVKHLKSLAVIKSPLVIEEEPKRTLADRRPNLTLPEKTSSNVGRSRN
jgi:hypothetical protein